jgi:hypothetical protein
MPGVCDRLEISSDAPPDPTTFYYSFDRRKHDRKARPRVVCRNADDLRAVAADNGFQDCHSEYAIAALDVDYLVQYRV